MLRCTPCATRPPRHRSGYWPCPLLSPFPAPASLPGSTCAGGLFYLLRAQRLSAAGRGLRRDVVRSAAPLPPLGSAPGHWRAADRLPAAVPASWRPRQAGRHPGLQIGRADLPSARARQGVGPSGCSEQCKVMRTPKGWAERRSRPAPPAETRGAFPRGLGVQPASSRFLPVVSSASSSVATTTALIVV